MTCFGFAYLWIYLCCCFVAGDVVFVVCCGVVFDGLLAGHLLLLIVGCLYVGYL